jgi:hypothetical protein
MIQPLNLPKAPLKLSRNEGVVFVWCEIRNKKLKLTPEEWVRQHVIHFLITFKNVPKGVIASEQTIQVNGLTRRCDLVVYNSHGKPILLIECKATDVALNEKVLHQIAQYNFNLNVDYLLLTNGIQQYNCFINRSKNTIDYLENLPNWNELS